MLVVWIFGVIGVIGKVFFWFLVFFNGEEWNFLLVGIGFVVFVIILDWLSGVLFCELNVLNLKELGVCIMCGCV